MPRYSTFHNFDLINVYTAQRPATAACKAFTTLRKANSGLLHAIIDVQTEGKKHASKFHVEYKMIEDDFLGSIKRPVAVKIEHSNTCI